MQADDSKPSGGVLVVAVGQMDTRLERPDLNLATMLRLMKRASRKGAGLIVFPEVALQGIGQGSSREALALAETVPGPSTEVLSAAARQFGMHVVVGMVERAEDEFYNVAVLLGPDGVVGKYRKVHLTSMGADALVVPGDDLGCVFETPIGRIGLAVCFDVFFPEVTRSLALRGAQIIASPTNPPVGPSMSDKKAVDTMRCFCKTRAMENQVFFVWAARCGERDGHGYQGLSMIFGPSGDLLAKATHTSTDGRVRAREQLILASVRPQDAQKMVKDSSGQGSNMLTRRRPSAYGLLCK